MRAMSSLFRRCPRWERVSRPQAALASWPLLDFGEMAVIEVLILTRSQVDNLAGHHWVQFVDRRAPTIHMGQAGNPFTTIFNSI